MSIVAVAEPVPVVLPYVRDEPLYEVVNGKRVEKPPMGLLESLLASDLVIVLGSFVRTNQLGRVVSETLFALPGLQRERRPDLAFVSFERWPKDRVIPRMTAWQVVPELAIEVVSPSNTADDVLLKMHDYFRAGVHYVWIIWPPIRQVYVYESPTEVRILAVDAELSGDPVIPGFRLPLASLFDIPAEPAPPLPTDQPL